MIDQELKGVAGCTDSGHPHMRHQDIVVASWGVKVGLLMHHCARDEIFDWPVEVMQAKLGQIVHPSHIEIDSKATEEDDADGIRLAQANAHFRAKAVVIEVSGNRSHHGPIQCASAVRSSRRM